MRAGEYREAERELWESVGLEPSEQQVQLPCAGVSTRVQVVGDGPPVLFVHGVPNSGSTWAPLLPHLEGFRCFLVDRPGTGLSEDFVLAADSPEAVYEFGRRFCAELLDGLSVDRAHFVGSSLGGFLGLLSAAEHPDRFDRMVQMACPAYAPGMKVPPIMRALTLRPVRRLLNALPPNERVAKQMLRQIGHGKSIAGDRIPQSFFDWYLALQRYTNTMRNDGEMIGRAGSPRGFPDELTIPEQLLRSVRTPTLFIWGEDDTFGDADVAELTVAPMPDAELDMLADSGHLPWLDDPAEVGRRTAAFLHGPTAATERRTAG